MAEHAQEHGCARWSGDSPASTSQVAEATFQREGARGGRTNAPTAVAVSSSERARQIVCETGAIVEPLQHVAAMSELAYEESLRSFPGYHVCVPRPRRRRLG